MTPASRCAAAIEILASVEGTDKPADRVIAEYLRERRYMGAKDRQAVLAHVYSVIRNRMAIEWWIARASKIESAPRAALLAWLALGERLTSDAIAELFCGKDYAPRILKDDERKLVEDLSGKPLHPAEQPTVIAANCPEWLAPYLERRFGGEFLDEMEALNQEAPMDLRVNTIKTSREAVIAELAKAGIEAQPTRLSPWGLRLASRRPITGLDVYREGLVEIQDEGSQIVSLLTDARAGQSVVDFCAGGGGKSLALAVAMRNKGEIAALDISMRLARSGPRVKRAGARIIKAHRLSPDDPWLKEHRGSADRVLVDAPCTGIGAWRRDPTARLRLTFEELERVMGVQRQVLHEAADLVKPGGRLIYATCSLLREENEDQVEWFLSHQSEFMAVPVKKIWAELIERPCPAEGPYLVLTPKQHKTDGFFVAVLECLGVAG